MKRVFGRWPWALAGVAMAACDTQSVGLVHSAPPTVTIAAPDDFYVARPSLRIAATCLDDNPNGCVSLTVTVGGSAILATAQGSIDQTVSLAAYDGQSVALTFAGRDSAGHVTTVSRRVFVESSSHLTEVAVVNGLIMDVQPDRILFLNQSAGGNTLTTRDRSSGNDQVIYDETGHVPRHAFLTPPGAIFLEQTGAPSNDYVVHEWQPGGLTDFGVTSLLVVKERYAVFRTATGLTRRDVVAGTNVVVSTDAANAYYDVATNGDVVYWVSSPSGQIFRFRGGAITQLTNDALGNMHPVTDGIRVVYMKNQQVTVYDSSGEHVLTPGDGQARGPLRDYQATNGWVAYTKTGAGGVLKVWSRSPAGDDTQLTYVGTSTTLDALGPNGEVVLINNGGGVSRRYLAVPDYSMGLRDISSSLGYAFFQNGNLFIAIGRSLFQVNP